MKCKFCDSEMKSRSMGFGSQNFIYCDNHKPVRVSYRLSPSGDKWRITYENYSLVYWNNNTYLNKVHKDASTPDKYYESLKKFDFDLKIKPEDFVRKLPTMLTFL